MMYRSTLEAVMVATGNDTNVSKVKTALFGELTGGTILHQHNLRYVRASNLEVTHGLVTSISSTRPYGSKENLDNDG